MQCGNDGITVMIISSLEARLSPASLYRVERVSWAWKRSRRVTQRVHRSHWLDIPTEDRERPRSRTRTRSYVTGDNIPSHHFHSSCPPFFYPFYIAILPTRVVGDQTSNKLPYKCHTYVKYLASEEFDIIVKISIYSFIPYKNIFILNKKTEEASRVSVCYLG